MGTDTLIKDIYDTVMYKKIPESVDLETEIDKFGEAVKEIMRDKFSKKYSQRNTLRMSNIGKRDRYLWMHNQGVRGEKMQPHTLIKFLYGHLIEEMLLFLVRLSGHEVTDEQKKVNVEGITGHMDCKIDGVLTDVKSTSTYGFKKFDDESLVEDDGFGYIDQAKGYAHAEGLREIAWLAMDKQNGHLTFLKYDLDDKNYKYADLLKEDIVDRIKHVKEVVKQDKPPEHCYDLVPDGKSGNMKLPTGCSYCQFKKACYPGLRAFKYYQGPRFLAEVVNEPNVPEIEI